MTTAGHTEQEARHLVLEGVLLRLARRPDATEFVLRGGVLMRHWFRPVPRAVEDLDLISAFPFSVEEALLRFQPVFETEVDDGVTFGSVRGEGIFLDTGSPGVRVFASGTVGGVEVDFHTDLTARPFPRPPPVFEAIPTTCGEVARVWACRPEAVAAQKVQALVHLGLHSWRPKDLNDLRLLLERVPMDASDLRDAVAAYMTDLNRPATDAVALFGPDSWWGLKFSSARWLDFAAESKGMAVPRELADVAAGIAERLNPILEGLR